MTVLVTGGLGLVGFEAVRALAARGEEVVSFDRRAPAERERLAGVKYMQGDLNDYPRLFATIKKHGVTKIAHTGAASGPMVEADNPFSVIQTNILGTVNVYEAARVFDIKRVVYTSSLSVYCSLPPEATTEDAPMRPNTVYGVTKVTGDLLAEVYSARHGLDAVALRLSTVYGPRRATDCVLRDMLKDALAGRETRLPHGAADTQQYVYAKDAADAILGALDAKELRQRAYHVTGGAMYTIPQVADLVREVFPSARIEIGPGHSPLACDRPLLDISAAARDLGYQPAYSLPWGIEEYVVWLRENEW